MQPIKKDDCNYTTHYANQKIQNNLTPMRQYLTLANVHMGDQWQSGLGHAKDSSTLIQCAND